MTGALVALFYALIVMVGAMSGLVFALQVRSMR